MTIKYGFAAAERVMTCNLAWFQWRESTLTDCLLTMCF